MIRHRLLQLTAPLAVALILFYALFTFLSSSGSALEASNHQDYDVAIGPENQKGEADQGETITYTYWVTNTGTETDTYGITATNDLDWKTIVSTNSITLTKDISQSIVLSIEVDIDAVAGPVITTITATSTSFITSTDFATNTINVRPVYSVTITKDEDGNAFPGTTIEYTHTVTNKGNRIDTFDITASSNHGYTVNRDPVVIPNLGPGISDTVVVSIEIPPGTSADVVDETTVTATSRGPGSKSDDVVDTTTVAEVLGVDIEQNESGSADPGTTAVYTHTVTNDGNANDTYNITADSDQGFDTRVSPTSLNLNKGANGVVSVEIDIPPTAGSDIVDVTTVTATSDKNPNVKDFVTDTTDVNQVYGVEIVKNESSTASPGNTVVYEHTVTNKGNGTDTFDITVLSTRGYAEDPVPKELELNAGQRDTVEVSVVIPIGAEVGTDTTTVTATSRGSGNPSQSVEDKTTITEALGVDISKNESGNADPGTTAAYTHTVTNQGNAKDTYNISASSDQGFEPRVSPTSLTLKKDETGLVRVEIDVPAAAGSDTVDKTTVTAASEKNASVKDDVTDTTNINQIFGVEILKNESSTVFPGTTVVYEHTLTNKGNGPDAFDISAKSDQGYTTTPAPASLNLNAGQSQKIKVSVIIPAGAADGTVDKTTVTATSKGSGKATDDVVDTTTINLGRLFIPIVTSTAKWNQVGASSWEDEDQATSIDVCRSDSDLIFAGTEDALRLFDGNSWTTIAGDVPKGDVISSIAMNKACDIVYVVVFDSGQDPEINAHGVWEGALNQGSWTWQKLTGGVDVTLARKVALSEGTLFAAGGFGITYWDNNAWVATNLGGTLSSPVMDLSVADGVNNEGPLYAVKWLDRMVYHNTNPGSNPADWTPIAGLDDIPDNGSVRSVAGDESNVRYVGTTGNLYGLTGNSWGLVNDQESRTVLISGNVYAGFSGEPGDGVYISRDQGASFSPYNEGWKTPQTIFVLVDNPNYLFAATSAGVFKR